MLALQEHLTPHILVEIRHVENGGGDDQPLDADGGAEHVGPRRCLGHLGAKRVGDGQPRPGPGFGVRIRRLP